MWGFIKVILGIVACAFSCASWWYIYEEIWYWDDFICNGIILLGSMAAIAWATAFVWYGFGIIYLGVMVVATAVLLFEGDYSSAHFFYTLLISIVLFFAIPAGITKRSAIAWDMENYETEVIEYSIMGVSGDQLVLKDSQGETTSLKSIAMNSVQWKVEDVLIPYVYREKYIYTKYDYSKEPPEILEKGKEKWSEYILYGSEKQIQELFGYEQELNFEQ